VLTKPTLLLRAKIVGDEARYSFSTDDGRSFHKLGEASPIHFSWWKGARPSLFTYTTQPGDAGAVDIDWVHYVPLGPNPW
jgi:hypothetical protein